MKQTILSILVCTVTNRVQTFLPKIIKELSKQAEGKPVEILYLGDNRTMSIGEKRNNLLLMARGKYACFVDDDDRVSEDYVDMILEAAKNDTDVIVFKAFRTQNGVDDREVIYNAKFQKDFNDEQYYYRLPNHLMPIKLDILYNCFFKEINYGEDADLARAIKPYIKTQAEINKVLYYYDFSTELSESTR